MSWLQIKKKLFRRVTFLYSTQQQWTISQLNCDMWWKVDFIQQPITASSVTGPRSSKALPKAKFALKKVMVTVWWSAACLIHYNFLNPSETTTYEKFAQQITERHWKLQCPQLALANRTGSVSLHDSAWLHIIQPALQKLDTLGCEVLPHLPYSPDPSPASYHFLNHLDNFLQGECFHNQQDAEYAFQEFIESWRFLHYRNKQTYFSLAKCFDCNGSYFD